ncbi:hypothetical protein K7X08_002951 [Anisodus acutangulus]|uniref:Uncharacterized protein n=1 Tax=Anisodus acutangulus TaxID=402998 RepID=A0A9Q1RI94_9SOLA|nr:hypothetical protein K7X08_002951 [Anisodus acutangulus]
MYEYGEEMIIESYKVPWLIWIQLIVMILLVLLLFFGFNVLDLPNDTGSSSSCGPTGSSHGNIPSNSTSTLQQKCELRLRTIDPCSPALPVPRAYRELSAPGCPLYLYSRVQHLNGNQNIKGETEASTSHEIARADESQERDGSAEKDTNLFKLLVQDMLKKINGKCYYNLVS